MVLNESPCPPLQVEVISELKSATGAHFDKIVQAVVSDSKRCISEILCAIDNNDGEALFQSAHTLKSVTAQIGAAQLVELAKKLEKNGKNGELPSRSPLDNDLYGFLENVLRELKNFTSSEFK